MANAFQEPVYLVTGSIFRSAPSGRGPWPPDSLPLALGLDAMRQLLLGKLARGSSRAARDRAARGRARAFNLARRRRCSSRRLEREGKRTGALILRQQ